MQAKAPKRRHGRVRRWLLRPLFWGLAALCVFVLVLQLLLDTTWARDSARTLITERLTAALDREINLVDLNFELFPLSIELWGLTIAGPEPEDANFIEIPFAAIEADLAALQNRRIHLQQVRVERPVVYLEFFPDKTHNMLKRRQGQPRPRRFDIYIDRLEIDRAEFGLDQQSVSLSLAADSVRTRMRGVGEMHLAGQLDANSVVVRLPGGEPVSVSVSARGSLRRGALEVESARIAGSDLTAEVSGRCEYPKKSRENRNCLFQALGQVQGKMLADVGYFPDLLGAVDFDGSLAWRPDLTGWRSRLKARDIAIWDRQIDSFEGSLVADRYGLRIGVDAAGYNGGILDGTVAWEAKRDGKPWTIDLGFRGLELDRLLADQAIPSTGYASRLDGRFKYRFTAGRSSRGDGRGEVEMVADSEHPGLPLVGAFPMRIEEGVVRTDSVSLQSARQSILADGWYDLEHRHGAFDYEIASAEVAELLPLLPFEPSDEPPLWLPKTARGTLEGTLYVVSTDTSVIPAGTTSATASSTPAPSTPATSARSTSVDRLASDGGLPPGTAADLRLRLTHVETPGVTAANVSGAMHLTGDAAKSLWLELGDGETALLMRGEMPYTPNPENLITLSFDAQDWPLSQVHSWLDFKLPVDGLISGNLDLEIDDVSSYGELEARVSPATLSLALGTNPSEGALSQTFLADVDTVAGRLAWDAHQIRFTELEAIAPSGTVELKGTHDWTSGALDLELRSASLQLAEEPLRQVLPRSDIRGEVSIDGLLSGWLHDPRLELTVRADSLALGSRVLAGRPSRLDVSWGDGHLRTAGQLLDLVSLDGGGVMGSGQTDLALRIAGDDLQGLAELLFEEPPAELAGRFDGTLNIHGDRESTANVDLRLEHLVIELGDRTLSNLEPVEAQLAAENLLIHSLHLAEAETATEFHLKGTLGYLQPTILDLDLESTVSGIWLALLDIGFDVEGFFDLEGKIAGSFEQPTFEGDGRLAGGRVLLSEEMPLELSELSGNLTFVPGQVVIDGLEGALGGGRVEIEGQATLARTDRPLIYRLQLTGTGLDLRNLEGWAAGGDIQLSLTSTGDGHLLDGRARLDTLEYTLDIRADFAQLMRGFLQRQRLEVAPMDSLLSVVDLNIDIEAPGTLRVKNNIADFTGNAQFLLRGDLAQPVLFGEAEIDPDGTLIYNSTDYEIERGRIVFANPYELDPEIDLVAVTRVREFDVTLAVDGTFDRLETRFSSEPPLPDLEVFRLLASGGDANTDSTLLAPQRTEIEEDPSTSAATFLYGQAASVIGQRVNNLFGFDKFRIDPLTGSGDQLSKARVTVGKRLSKDVLVTLSTDPSSTEDQRLRLEWQVTPGLVLVLSQNGDDSYSTDARWESSF